MVKVPLEILNLHGDGFHLLVEVVVFGQIFKAVLDTGASRTVFDKTIMVDLMGQETLLELTETLSTGLGTNSMQSFSLLVPKLQIGKLHITNFTTAAIDLSSINYAYEEMDLKRVIGVIGGDILMEYKAIIDYSKAILKLFDT